MTHKGYNLEKLGEAMHNAISATCVAVGQAPYPGWASLAPDNTFRLSTYAVAKSIVDSPGIAPGVVWRHWAEDRLAQGWRWGPVTDKASKVHALLPRPGQDWAEAFAALPFSEQLKDMAAIHAVQQAMRAQEAEWAREMARVAEVSLPQGPWERTRE